MNLELIKTNLTLTAPIQHSDNHVFYSTETNDLVELDVSYDDPLPFVEDVPTQEELEADMQLLFGVDGS